MNEYFIFFYVLSDALVSGYFNSELIIRGLTYLKQG